MKFSHSLQFNAVPEWASYYVSYSQLKKVLYQIERELFTAGPPRAVGDEESIALIDKKARANAQFLPILNKELEKIVAFYYRKEKELAAEYHSLKSDVSFAENYEETFGLNTQYHFDEAARSHAISSREFRSLRSPGRSTTHDAALESPLASASSGKKNGEAIGFGGMEAGDEEELRSLPDGGKQRWSLARSASMPPVQTSDNVELPGDTDRSLQEMPSSPSPLSAVRGPWALGAPSEEARENRKRFRTRVIDLFVQLSELKSFVSLNHTGFSKILKKYDKVTNNDLKQSYLMSVVNEAYPFKTETRNNLDAMIQDLEQLYAHVACRDNVDRALRELKSHLREHLVWERNTVWREMVGLERKATGVRAEPPEVEPTAGKEMVAPLFAKQTMMLAFIVALFLVLLKLKTFDAIEQQNCLAILVLASLMWATEVAPLFVTSMLIPFLVIVLRVHRDETTHARLSPPDATKKVFAAMFSPVIMLLLGGFAIAAALSKYDIAKAMATWVLSKAGTKPSRVLFANMIVATLLSMWISNVAAPVLCFSLIQPILRTVPSGSTYARALIIGIALASNVGGMASPISSPQNIIGIDNMDPAPSWLEWFFITLPIAFLSDLFIWLLLLWVYNPTSATSAVHSIRQADEPLSRTQIFVCTVTALTVVLWCFESQLESYLGDMGVIAIFPLVAFFGTGVLTKDEFNSFPWAVIMLAMGGITLGKAVESSGLLFEIAKAIQQWVVGFSPFEVLVVFVTLMMIVATFLSHTVSALIILPIVAQVGSQIPGGRPRLLVMGSTLMCSGAMGLPMSGFPNMNAIMLEDEVGSPYLTTLDFLQTGIPGTVIVAGFTLTLGYLLMNIIGY